MWVEILQTTGPTLTGAAALWAAIKAHGAYRNTNSIEGKSVNEIAVEVRDEARVAASEARQGRELVELHMADTKRHVY